VGDTLDGRFELRAVIGDGGMGQVFRAYDHQAAREVALKLLTPRYLGRPEREQRFLREAELGRRARHPHLVEYLDAGRLRYEGWPYVSMELVEGKDLGLRLARGALPPRTAVRVARQVAGALRALHRAGVVHRDVTPLNVLMRGDEAVLIDLSHAGDSSAPQIALGQAGRLTQPHEVPGTHFYMPREQALADPAHPAMDVYAFGVTLAHMLTGRAPSGYDRQTFIAMQREGKIVPPRVDVRVHSEVPPELAELVHACTRSEAEGRPTMDELVHRLDELLTRLSMPAERTADLGGAGRTGRAVRKERRAAPPRELRAVVSVPIGSSDDVAVTPIPVALEPEPAPASSARTRRWVPLALFVVVAIFVGGWAMWPRSEPVEGSPAAPIVRQDDAAVAPEPLPADRPAPELAAPPEPAPESPTVMAASAGERGDGEAGEAPALTGNEDAPRQDDGAPEHRGKAKAPGQRKAPNEAAPDPSTTDECVKTREHASEAKSRHDWKTVARLASRSQCWDDQSARRRLLVRALFQSDEWAECVRAGGNSKDAEVKRWVDMCKRQLG
jgi:serine/threonine-protein kinase